MIFVTEVWDFIYCNYVSGRRIGLEMVYLLPCASASVCLICQLIVLMSCVEFVVIVGVGLILH